MSSNQPITIYIAAAPALAAEREALARMIAELPVSLTWRIVQTPASGEQLDFEALVSADLFFLIMGADTYAPVGLEWHRAHQAGRPTHAFLKRGSRTPAGQVFIQQTHVAWQSFTAAADLSRQARRLLARHLVRQALAYGLTPAEVEKLEALQKADQGDEQSVEAEGAGHSAVILSRDRFSPSEGVIIDD